MRAGALRHVVELQRNSPTNVDHERIDNWSTYATVRAEKLEPKGDEVQAALQTDAVMRVSFRLRHREDVKPTDRLLFDGRVFDIRLPSNPDGRQKALLLHCTEHHSDGD